MGLLSPSFVLSAISILFRPYMFFTSQFHEVHHGHIIRPALYAVDIFCLLAGLLSFDYPVWMSFNELKLVFRYLKYTRSSLRSYSSIFSPWYRYSDINWQFLCDIWSLPERRSLKQEKKAGNPHIFLIWSSPRFHYRFDNLESLCKLYMVFGFRCSFSCQAFKISMYVILFGHDILSCSSCSLLST